MHETMTLNELIPTIKDNEITVSIWADVRRRKTYYGEKKDIPKRFMKKFGEKEVKRLRLSYSEAYITALGVDRFLSIWLVQEDRERWYERIFRRIRTWMRKKKQKSMH